MRSRPRPATGAAADAGFTLVELLVGLALMALAAVLLTEGFSASRGALKRMGAREDASETLADAQGRLRARLEQMTVRARFERDTPYVELEGRAERLDFLSAPPLGESAGPPRRERVWLSPDGELQLQPLDGRGEAEGDPDVLLRHVAALQIAYYEPDAAGLGGGWRDVWADRPGPPQLVRVRVEFFPGDRRVWPELMARPAASVDGQCVIDGDRGTCRGRS